MRSARIVSTLLLKYQCYAGTSAFINGTIALYRYGVYVLVL